MLIYFLVLRCVFYLNLLSHTNVIWSNHSNSSESKTERNVIMIINCLFSLEVEQSKIAEGWVNISTPSEANVHFIVEGCLEAEYPVDEMDYTVQ